MGAMAKRKQPSLAGICSFLQLATAYHAASQANRHKGHLLASAVYCISILDTASVDDC